MALSKMSDILTIEHDGVIRSLLKADTCDKTIGHELLMALDKVGDRVALIDAASAKTWTGREAAGQIRRISASLVTAGVTKGQVVCFLADDEDLVACAMALMAIWVTGAVYTSGGSFKYPFEEVRRICELTRAEHLIVSDSLVSLALQVSDSLPGQIKKMFLLDPAETEPKSHSIPRLSELEPCPDFTMPVDLLPDDPATILFSSGTTGLPKAVMRSQKAEVAYRLSAVEPFTFGGRPGDRLLVQAPFYHAGSTSILIVAVLNGAEAVICGKDTIAIGILSGVTSTSMIEHVAADLVKLPGKLVHSLSDALIIGNRPSRVLWDKVQAKYNLASIRNLYGSTETGSSHLMPNFVANGDYECSGAPLAGVEYKVKNLDTGKNNGPLEAGEIYVKTPRMFSEYVGDQEATKKAFDEDGFFKTGDIGYYNESGLLYVTERIAEVIAVGPHKVSPTELENVLLRHAAVKHACVVGVFNDLLGQVPKAFVVKRTAHETVTEDELIQFSNRPVSSHKELAGGLEFIDSFPLTSLGKVDRRLLKMRAVCPKTIELLVNYSG